MVEENETSQDWEKAPAAETGSNGVPEPSEAQAAPQAAPVGHRGRSSRAGVGAAPPQQQKAYSRPRGKAGDIPDKFDPEASGAPKFSSHEAEILWPELIQWLEAKGRSPYDVMVNVVRIEPPGRAGIGEPFEAHACMGDGTSTPSAALKFMVEEFYHLQSCRTPARYELQFVWRANGQYVTHAHLSCASPAEIIALRNAAHARRMYAQSYPGPGAQVPAPGLGRPPAGAFPQQQPQPQPQPQQFGYPPPPYGYYGFQPQPQRDPELERRLAALEEENRRLRAERSTPPRPAYAGVGAPPGPPPQQQPVTAETIGAAVAAALKQVGLGAPAAQPTDVFGVMKQGMAMMREFKRFGQESIEMFGPDDEERERELPILPAPPETDANEDSPYDITELPSQWDDGSKAKIARDRETGKVDLFGTLMVNTHPTKKLIDAGAAFMERFGRREGLAGIPEEEEQFSPPPQQQQLPPPEAAPAPPPPPPPDPDSDQGWGMSE